MPKPSASDLRQKVKEHHFHSGEILGVYQSKSQLDWKRLERLIDTWDYPKLRAELDSFESPRKPTRRRKHH